MAANLADTCGETPEDLEKRLMEKLLHGLKPGAALLPKECLNITDEEWNQVKIMVDKDKTDQL